MNKHMAVLLKSCQILNPSIQTAILSALIQPSGYLLHDLTTYVVSNGTSDSMSNGEIGCDFQRKGEIRVRDPDTSRLFHLYMEAGRTINVYDWFEAFAVSLEGETDDHIQDVDHADGMGTDVGRSKKERRREVYARFMRSLHELDLLGMLRWSGRGTGKKGGDCAAKVVWATSV
jgi:origin recognition complex subunit 3